jgi:hypothetical protein
VAALVSSAGTLKTFKSLIQGREETRLLPYVLNNGLGVTEMSKYLPATLGIAVMLMASTALANDVSVSSGGKVAEQLKSPPFGLPATHFLRMPTGPFVSLRIKVAEVLPAIPPEALKLEMLMSQVKSFSSHTAQWGVNPMEGAMWREISTVGGPGTKKCH